jgi:PAS fold
LAEQRNILAAIRTGRDLSVETVRLHKDGRRIEVSLTCFPLTSPERNMLGFCTIVRDISEPQRKEGRQQQLIDELDHRVKNLLEEFSTSQHTDRQSLAYLNVDCVYDCKELTVKRSPSVRA